MPIHSILLVDDDPDDRFVFQDALQSIDTTVSLDTAFDGVDALKKLGENTRLPQLIFLDLNMPRMNGKRFLKEIKSSGQYRSIPVIVYSTSSNPTDVEETKQLGATEFVTKPNNYDELCQMLSSALNKTY